MFYQWDNEAYLYVSGSKGLKEIGHHCCVFTFSNTLIESLSFDIFVMDYKLTTLKLTLQELFKAEIVPRE